MGDTEADMDPDNVNLAPASHAANHPNHNSTKENFAAQGSDNVRPASYSTIPGILNSKSIGRAGRLVMAGMSQISDAKNAKLCHTWHHRILPDDCFVRLQTSDKSSFNSSGVLDLNQSGSLSGVQLLLTDPLDSYPGVRQQNDINDDNASLAQNRGVHDPLGPHMGSNVSLDTNWKHGINCTKYLNALNFPVASNIHLAATTGSQPPHTVTGSKPATSTHSGHHGFRLKNYVSGPTVMVDKICVDMVIRTESVMPKLLDAYVTAHPAATPMEFLNRITNGGNLDFRVLVLQNTDSYKTKYSTQPALWKDLLCHPMGNPMEGVLMPANAMGSDPAVSGNFTPVTGWPMALADGISENAPVFSQQMMDNLYIPNQKSSAYQVADNAAYGPYAGPKVDDLMHNGINPRAYRVLHDEKFSLSVHHPLLPGAKNPAERKITLNFPVNGMVDISSAPGYRQRMAGQAAVSRDELFNSFRGRSYGWDARNIYHNAPRVIILCAPPGGKTVQTELEVDAPFNISGLPKTCFNTKTLWTVSTSGYTVYRDAPEPNVKSWHTAHA